MYNKLNTKVNNLENKIPYAATLFHINQNNTDKQRVDKKIGDFDKNIPDLLFLIQKLEKLRIRYLVLVI